jgi:hypothetical protein
MKIAASRSHRALGALMIVAALAYLTHFVPRGWIPHDEGMLGQSADYVLRGAVPHLDYEEAYTGGLSWLYATLFRISGVDLLNVRWLLFAGAAWAMWSAYAILRRYLQPTGAALATWVALAWSFPNYFAGLPSWWLLILALACLWARVRHIETGQSRYLIAAGLAVGAAIAIKQTGVYLLVALVLSLLYDATGPRRVTSWSAHAQQWIRWGAALGAVAFALVILAPRVLGAEGIYLFLPVVACAVPLFQRAESKAPSSNEASVLTRLGIATAAAAVPLAWLALPYLTQDRLWEFVNGSIFVPRRRLAFASAPMHGALAIVAGLPMLALVFAAPRLTNHAWSRFFTGVWLGVAVALPIAALWNITSYQIIWQSARAVAALLPLGICWQLMSGKLHHPEQRSLLFTSAALLAWSSLNQFPFAAPVYFCYIAPLAVIAAVTAASANSAVRPHTMLPWAVMLLLFAVLSTNRGYIELLGVSHAPRRFETALRLHRAHLKVSARDAHIYRYLVFSVTTHLRGGQLIAGPDCPEVYFLLGLTNPSGRLFDFLSHDRVNAPDEDDDMLVWSKGEVIVLNHAPQFSRALSADLSEKLRREFPYGTNIGAFEVRWR